jgi:integrase
MKLAEFLTGYIRKHGLRGRYAQHVTAHCREFVAFVDGRDLSEYTCEMLNAFAERLEAEGSKRTTQNKLVSVLAVLRAAASEAGRLDPFGKLVRNRVALAKRPRIIEPGPATPPRVPETVRELLDAYCLERGLCHNTVVQYSDSVRVFERFLCVLAAPLATLSAENINRFALWLEPCVRPRTVKNRVGNLSTLARAALDAGYIPALSKIVRVRVPQQVVRGFTPDEVRRLLIEAAKLNRSYPCGVPRALWWTALVRLNWDTGLRISDILTLRFTDLRDNRTISVSQQKTKRVVTSQLSDETVQCVAAIREPHRELILPWHARREALFKQFRMLAERAGVNGTTKFLRRGGATQMWKLRGPTAAARYLGHTDLTGSLAQRNYLDQSQVCELAPPPPLSDTLS